MRILRCLVLSAVCICTAAIPAAPARTLFQTGDDFSAAVDIRSDAAVVYGVNDSFTSRVDHWRAQGYKVHMMTGAAWGGYSDYIDGRFDGVSHKDEGQVDPQGNVIWHHPGVPYMVPTTSYTVYLKSLVHKAIDAGVEAVHLEEPEFWSRAGYSEGFKKMWKQVYASEWQRPDSSPDAFWRASRLKYMVYNRTLADIFSDAKAYAGQQGRTVECYVPTHSLINYSQWAIVSPESSLMDLPNCDGYIAQVWTGTARTPNHYRGKNAERTFETAFLEYSSMFGMVAPTGRTVYFLADPVEDDPNHTWDDYRKNYERTVAASLMFGQVQHFEVMPWPNRVFTYEYPSGSYSEKPKSTIPPPYAAELMTVVNALGELETSAQQNATSDVGVLVSDTMMFQRGNNWGENGPIQFDGFYGLALPLIKAGIPVECPVLERLPSPGALGGLGTLVMSYEAMKPMYPEFHDRLAEWVRSGGNLVYVGDDSDPFHGIREWWNEDGKTSATARQDLFHRLERPSGAADWRLGQGRVWQLDMHPATLARSTTGAQTLMALVKQSLPPSWRDTNLLKIHRGHYVAGAVMDEGNTTASHRIPGRWLNLFTSDTAVAVNPEFAPGEVFLLREIAEKAPRVPRVLATTARMEESTRSLKMTEFFLRGPSGNWQHQTCLHSAQKPVSVDSADGSKVDWNWDDPNRLIRLHYGMKPEGVTVRVHY